MWRFFVLLGLTTGCSSHFFQEEQPLQAKIVIEEMRQEIADVKHELRLAQVALQILDEKCQSQDQHLTALKVKNPKWDQLSMQLSLVEKRLVQMEKFQEKVVLDLRHLSAHTEQHQLKIEDYEKEIAFQKRRLDEVGKLKNTLNSISQAVQQKNQEKPASFSGEKKHKVRPGDSLEKISRQYGVSVTALKRENRLSSDRIQIGQELEIPYE